jgi:hypothetical protein
MIGLIHTGKIQFWLFAYFISTLFPAIHVLFPQAP